MSTDVPYRSGVVSNKTHLPHEESEAANRAPTPPPVRRRSRWSTRWPDVLGVAWVLGSALLALVPVAMRGSHFGAFDLIAQHGLTAQSGVTVHNAVGADQTSEVLPWITQAWQQVHHGHLPLWNRYEGLGTPLAFNWGSGAFSLPALVSYLTPVRFIYWVQTIVSLVVGGTGAYFFARVLRVRPLGAAFAGTAWVFSGPFFGYLGLPDTSVISWAGWQFAAVVLVIRGERRVLATLLLAVSLAFSILAGNAQVEVVIALPLAVFAAVALLHRHLNDHREPIARPVVDLGIASIAGAALAAPLALPGLQIASHSVRSTTYFSSAFSYNEVYGFVFQSFWGLPIPNSFLDAKGLYIPAWCWVGAIPVGLSVVAVGVRWRRPEITGLAAAFIVALAIAIVEPVESVLDKLPSLGHTWWDRSIIAAAFCLAMLGGVGLDALLRQPERSRARRWGFGAFGGIAVCLGLIWLFGRGGLPAFETALATPKREQSFVWPAISIAVGAVVLVAMLVAEKRGAGGRSTAAATRWAIFGLAGGLLVFQTASLIIIDEPLPSSSPTSYPNTPGIIALRHATGSSLIGLGHDPKGASDLGLFPDINVAYGIHEFAVYDPITPASYFTTWEARNGTSPGSKLFYTFVPAIDSATVARRYGISYVLEPRGGAGPIGSVFDAHVGDEDLFRIPGAAEATLVTAVPSKHWPSTDAPGSPVPVDWTTPSSIRIVTNSTSAKVLRLRVASFPGWHATIDGKPLPLSDFLSMMFQAKVPAGRHVIELHYWPERFTGGIVVAACTVALFAVAGVVGVRRRSRRRTPSTSS